MDVKQFVEDNKGKLAVASMPVVALAAPAFAIAEEGSGTSTIQTGVTNMATTVANDGVAMINAILPVVAPLIAAVLVAALGVKLVRRFAR